MSNDVPLPPSTVATSPSLRPGAEALTLGWSQPAGLVGLSIKNFLLRIITLGIYHFWGKTEVRQRIWAAARINGEPLQYTGNGKELLIGFLVVLGVIVVPTFLVSLVLAIAFGPNSPVLSVFQVVLYVVFFLLIGVGIHRATRYRLSRTRWRGIRGGLEGSSWQYGWTYFWTAILLLLSWGWASPWRSTKLQGLITNHMRFGNRPFRFDARSGELLPRFAVLWLSGLVIICIAVGALYWGWYVYLARHLTVLDPAGRPSPEAILTVIAVVYAVAIVGFLLYGMVSAWYRAHMMNHFAKHTTFEEARFKGTATGASLIWLTITNALMVLFTLGLLTPVAQARAARYFVERLQLEGSASLAEILQRAEDEAARGEGLAQAFDIDAF